MDPIEGAFFPAFVPAFFHNAAFIQAYGSFTSGHRLLAMDQLPDSLTPFHFIASVDNNGAVVIPSLGLSAISTVTNVQNLGWLLHCIFADPAHYPHLSPDTSPFMFRALFAGLLMQVSQCLAQPRTTAAWDSSARANPTRGRQNSFAFLFHVGQLFEIFSDWATPLNPKAHCFVAAPESHRARADLVVLGAATYDGANLHMKLEQWLTQFRAWFSPTALTSTAPPVAASFLATTPIFMRFITPPAAAAVSAKDRKRKAAEGPNDSATVTAKAAAAALKQRQKATGTSTTATTVVPAQLPPTSIPEVSQPSKLKAKPPLVCWTVSGKAKYPQGIGQMIIAPPRTP